MNIGTLTATLGVDASGLDQANVKMQVFSKKTINNLNAMAQRIRTFGYLSSAVVTAPMVAAGTASFKAAKDFEYAMQKIVGLTGTAQEAVNKWGKDIFAMSREFGKKPTELAEGLYYIASSGIKGAEALDVLRMSAKSSAAGLGETSDVANYLTSVLNAYRGTGITAAYATDVLVAAVREGKAEASGFASSMGQVIPIAAQLGVSIDQVAGAMAAITLTGSTAAQAGVYLKNIFNALLKEAGGGAQALTQASRSLGMMQVTFQDLRNILREGGVMALMQKLKDLTAVYGETLISEVIPEIRGMTGALALMGKNFEYNTAVMAKVKNSTGALSYAFSAVSNTIKVRYDRAIASANVSLITLGKDIATVLLPMLENLVKKLDRLTIWFDSLSESQKRFKLTVLGIIMIAGPLSLVFSVMIYSVTAAMTAINGLAAAFGFLTRTVAIGALLGKISAGFRGITLGASAVTGAFATTAVAAEAAAVGIATFLAGALGLTVIGIIVAPLFIRLTKKIKEFRKEIQEAKAVLDFKDVQMELDVSISSKRWDLGSLSKEGLESLRNDIGQRIALEQEDLDRARIVTAEKIKNEKDYLDKISALKSKERDWEFYKKEYERGEIFPQDYQNAAQAYAMSFQIMKKEIDSYVTEGMKMAEFDKQNSADIIQYYQKTAQEVDVALRKITDPIEDATKQLEILMERSAEVADALFELWKAESTITAMTRLLGGSFDDVAEKTSLYSEMLRKFVEIQVKAGYTIPEVAQKISELTKKLNELKQTKIDREFQLIEGQAAIFGNSFEVNSAKAELMKDALVDFNIQTRGTAEAFKYMGFAGIGMQAVLDGLTTRWKQYQVAAVGEEYQKTIDQLYAQRDAFKTLDNEINIVSAELEAFQSYMDVLYVTGQKGSAVWYIMANAIKEGQIALEQLQAGKTLAPLQAMAETFGRIDDKIELASEQMDLAKEKMDLLVSLGMRFTAQYTTAAIAYDHFKKVLESTEIEKTLAPFIAMNETFGGLSNRIQLVAAQLSIARDQFILYSEAMKAGQPGAEVGFKKATEDLKAYMIEAEKLARLEQIYGALGNAIADFGFMIGESFGGSEDAMSRMVDTLLATSQQIISIFLAEAAAAILAGETIKGMGIPGLIAGAIGVGLLMEAWSGAKTNANGAAKLAHGGIIPAGYANDTFPALLSSGEIVIPPSEYKAIEPLKQLALTGRMSYSEFFDSSVEKGGKKKLELAKLATGGVIPQGFPNDTYPALLSSGEVVVPHDGFASVIKILDKRLSDAITGYPVSDKSRLHGELDLDFVEEVVRKALERRIDPYTALAIPLQEKGKYASQYADPYNTTNVEPHQLLAIYADEIGGSLDVLRDKLKMAERLNYDTYAKSVQAFNGLGTLRQSEVGTKAYGVEVPEEGINMKENPLYGKRIEDIRNNILLQNEELVKYVDSITSQYATPMYPAALKQAAVETPIERASGISLNMEALSATVSEGIGNALKTTLAGGNIGKSLSGSFGGIFSSILSGGLTAAFGPIGGMIGKLIGTVFGANKMAKGGTVPAGFPNDTYPAMLSSYETVIPASKYKEYLKYTKSGKPIEFKDMPDMKFRPMEGELNKLTKDGSVPSGSTSDELQLLLATHEFTFPEEKFKALFSPLMKRPAIAASDQFNKKQKYTSKIFNYNNSVTENITKMTKLKTAKDSSSLSKYLSKLSRQNAAGDTNRTNGRVSKLKRVDDSTYSAAMLEKFSKMKKSNDKSLSFLNKIARGTARTESILSGSKYAKNVTKMAGGGAVPSGFPNDSFPALLSSGEVVLPKDVSKSIKGAQTKATKIHLTLDSKVKGKDMVLILRRALQTI